MKIARLLALAFIAFSLTGCIPPAMPRYQLYEGVRQDPNKVAYLLNDEVAMSFNSIAVIYEIDGNKGTEQGGKFNSQRDGSYHIELLPGKHVMQVSIKGSPPESLAFEVAAGKVYTVDLEKRAVVERSPTEAK